MGPFQHLHNPSALLPCCCGGSRCWRGGSSPLRPLRHTLVFPSPLPVQDVLWWGLTKVEPLLLGSRLRGKALKECMKHIHYEVGC